MQGHEVAIIASTETIVENKHLGYTKASAYVNEDGIPVTRLPYARGIPHKLATKLRIYPGLYHTIKAFNPDVIFLHDCQFLSIRSVKKYVQETSNVKLYIDGHTDFGNSAKGWVSRRILHGIIYKYCAQLVEPYTKQFYGVLPARVDFITTVYKIPSSKVSLLPLGADDSMLEMSRRDEIRRSVREEYGFRKDDFVIISGGKIDRRKNIHILMESIRRINSNSVRLLIFGTPDDEMKELIESLAVHKCITYTGWVSAKRSYELMFSADLGLFPGSHSVLWEQAVGTGLPCVFHKWSGMQHLDIGGNCKFLDSSDCDAITKTIIEIYQNKSEYMKMKEIVLQKGIDQFSYYRIAERCLQN